MIGTGDLEANGEVAFADFLVLSSNFGSAGVGYPGGDIDVDGEVAFADFLAQSTNFGMTSGAVASVPEPGSIVVLLFSVILVATRHRQR